MQISQLAQITGAKVLQCPSDGQIDTLVYDSRKSAGSGSELFVALQGAHHDGHDYLPQLYAGGTRYFLVSQSPALKSYPEVTFLLVSDTLKALQILAQSHRESFPELKVVGICGSNGKTIIKEWLSSILGKKWNVVKSPKSYNSQLGVPISVWAIEKGHQIGVFEAGISKVGEMPALAAIIQPSIGIFTNIGQAHSEGFASLEEKIKEKAQLLNRTAVNICRIDHSAIVTVLKAKPGKLITWGINHPDATIKIQSSGQAFHFEYEDQSARLDISFSNAFDLENIFHSIVAAMVLGEDEANIQVALDKLKPVPMRLEFKRGTNGTHILDDSYNNDLLGLEIALDYMRQQPRKLRKTVILSDILQSGKPPSELYKEVNRLLEQHQISRLIGIGQQIGQHQLTFSIPFDGFEDVASFLKHAPAFADETILVKGARDFGLERIVAFLEEKNHGTILEVNYESVVHNLNIYRKTLTPGTRLMVMVKAFAYGIGVEEIAHLLQYHKVDYLGVAYLDEAIHLRKKEVKLPIMIMNVDWQSFSLLETFQLEPEIYSLAMLRKFLEDCNQPPPIHLKIESGMNRLGFALDELPELIPILKANPQLKVAGVFTHFSSAEDPAEDHFTEQQAAIFENAYEQIADALGDRPLRHALNSAGIIRWPQYHYDMVRLGVGLYGHDTSGLVNNLRAIGTLKTKISQIKKVKEGASIGYSRKGHVSRESRIATIAIGYADGYSRVFGNGHAYVLINGQNAPTIGNVCMDMTMVDVTDIAASEGDEVVVFGTDPTIQDLARWANTIPYEILTNVSQRVKRVFVSE